MVKSKLLEAPLDVLKCLLNLCQMQRQVGCGGGRDLVLLIKANALEENQRSPGLLHLAQKPCQGLLVGQRHRKRAEVGADSQQAFHKWVLPQLTFPSTI